MNISNVTRDTTLLALQSTSATSPLTASQALTGTTSAADASTVQLSKPGELFKKLSELQQNDPAAFKQVAQKISDSLKSDAQSADSTDSTRLNKLADSFAQAAQSGDLSPLKPQHHHGHGGHGGGHGGGGGSSGVQASSAQRAYGGAQAGVSAPSETLQDAFTSALSIVDDALANETATGIGTAAANNAVAA